MPNGTTTGEAVTAGSSDVYTEPVGAFGYVAGEAVGLELFEFTITYSKLVIVPVGVVNVIDIPYGFTRHELLGGTVSLSIFPGAAALAIEGMKIDCAAINAIGNKRKR